MHTYRLSLNCQIRHDNKPPRKRGFQDWPPPWPPPLTMSGCWSSLYCDCFVVGYVSSNEWPTGLLSLNIHINCSPEYLCSVFFHARFHILLGHLCRETFQFVCVCMCVCVCVCVRVRSGLMCCKDYGRLHESCWRISMTNSFRLKTITSGNEPDRGMGSYFVP